MFPSAPFTMSSRPGAGMILLFLAAVFGTFLLENLFNATPLMAGYIVTIEAVAWGIGAVTFAGTQQNKEKLLIHTGSFFILITLFGYAFAMSSGVLWWIAVLAFFQSLGFDESMTNAELKQMAFWLFAAFTPLMLYANFAAWKLLHNSR